MPVGIIPPNYNRHISGKEVPINMTTVLAKVIDNDLTTDDWTLFLLVISSILIGIGIYYSDRR